jgi:hypothetical protein
VEGVPAVFRVVVLSAKAVVAFSCYLLPLLLGDGKKRPVYGLI